MPVVDETHSIVLHLKSASLVPPTGIEVARSPGGQQRRLHARRVRAVLAHMPDCRPGPGGTTSTNVAEVLVHMHQYINLQTAWASAFVQRRLAPKITPSCSIHECGQLAAVTVGCNAFCRTLALCASIAMHLEVAVAHACQSCMTASRMQCGSSAAQSPCRCRRRRARQWGRGRSRRAAASCCCASRAAPRRRRGTAVSTMRATCGSSSCTSSSM